MSLRAIVLPPVAALALVAGLYSQTATPANAIVPGQLAALLGAAPSAGYVLTGTGVAYSKQGSRNLRLRLWVWGSGHSHLTVDFPGGGRFEAIVDGKQAITRGPMGGLDLPPVGGLNNGCDLLPEGLLIADAASGGIGADDQGPSPEDTAAHRFRLYRAPAAGDADYLEHIATATAVLFDLGPSGLPERAEYAAPRKATVRVEYQHYANSGGIQYPTHVEKFVNGNKRLSLDFSGLTLKSDFSERDFAVPALPARKAPPGPAKRGGAPAPEVRP